MDTENQSQTETINLDEFPPPSAFAPGVPINSFSIRPFRGMHCARGIKRCKKCLEAYQKVEIVLLRLYIDDEPDEPECARPSISITRDSKVCHVEFDQLLYFNSETIAMAYAKQYGIKDIQFDEQV